MPIEGAALAARLTDLQTDNSFAALPPQFYTRLAARPLTEPRLLHANPDAAALIGLDAAALHTPEFLAVASGAAPLPGGDTLAAVYSGHQFGVWAGQLGDGRAHLLGEVRGPQGNWELQLKGAGMTPYSRMGDGRAVLRSSVREYLASEAMAGLGIPTTRALALVVSDDPVVRETVETAAIVTRMAPSFVRFGSFEHWASTRQPDLLRTLADYVIDRFYPQCRGAEGQDGPLVALLDEVMRRTARLMADWQAVGFCHGVMNTDNMSILGLTLDYGPYGFMDAFQLAHVCNHTDTQGRYAWNRQPSVGLWNLYRLAGALHALVEDADPLRAVLERYEAVFTEVFHDRMAAKIGLARWLPEDEPLLDELLRLMHMGRADFTLTFRRLAQAVRGEPQPFLDLFIDRPAAGQWLAQVQARHAADGRPAEARAQAMDRVNPLYVLRNHLAEQAIRAARQGDPSEIDTLLALLRDPYTPRPGHDSYAALPPDWAAGIEVSCSS
ncbi:protein adenylyltransferase SelO [Bordetella genomosp. 13]|uniref:protein adenylyltransferase SelO n=1 Tax=Bordetella genomosp. 13 TaxID=463040 RepID=UPI0011A4F2C1|nr:YdiU family protein [Bordetella genomosp. 13]